MENLARSWLWEIPPFKALLQMPGVIDINYDACMWGGRRKKAQRLRGTVAALSSMAKTSDGQHDHAPWRGPDGFKTGEEAEYPREFCVEVARRFADARGRQSTSKDTMNAAALRAATKQPASNKEKIKAAVGNQSRAGRHAALVPEYKDILTFTATQAEAAQCKELKEKLGSKGWLTSSVKLASGELPKDSRILDVRRGGATTRTRQKFI